jgi:arabinosyltransferase B
MTATTVSTRDDIAATRQDVRVTRWVATIAGLIGFVLSVATPLLPVVQTTAMLNWPQNGQLNSVTAPLISLTPVDVTATVPCSVIRALPPGGGVVLSTAPKKGKDAALNALFVVASGDHVDVTDRNVVLASVPRAAAVSDKCQRIEVTSTKAGAFANFVGLTDSEV